MTDYEKCSLKILAWKNHGDIPFRCSTCTDRDKEQRNCEMRPNHPFTLTDEDFTLTTCPLNYILSAHIPFIDKYYYLQEFPNTAKDYESTQQLFWEMYSLYKSEATKHDIEKMKEESKNHK